MFSEKQEEASISAYSLKIDRLLRFNAFYCEEGSCDSLVGVFSRITPFKLVRGTLNCDLEALRRS